MEGHIPQSLELCVLESPTQRKLDQPRCPIGANDFAEGAVRRAGQVGLDVRDRGVGEVGVVPDVEEVGSEADFLTFANLEIFDDGSVPVLLERAVVEVPAEVAETGGAEVRIAGALGWVQQRGSREGGGIEITVDDALVDITAG